MDGEDRLAARLSDGGSTPFDIPSDLCSRFTAQEYRGVSDAADRRRRLADLVSIEIIPRLATLHAVVQPADHPTLEEIAELARLVLSPDGREAAAYVTSLKERGLSVDLLFAELLEPAAQLLGRLWESDEVDFIDVTLGVGRLQALLSVFNCTHEIAASSDLRSVLMVTVPGEQHSFGVAMVERLLDAGGWRIHSEREARPVAVGRLVAKEWFAVAGVALSDRGNLEDAAATVKAIRNRSCNPRIGIMVGGPVFSTDPALALAIGADGTASTAATAVVLAQKLLDQAIAGPAVDRNLPSTLRVAAGSAARFAN
jgi:methanogenic corrinoid protein MtbC1